MRPTVKNMLSSADAIKLMMENQYKDKMEELKILGEQELQQYQQTKALNEMFAHKEQLKANQHKYFEFCQNVKKTLLAECINNLYSKALETKYMNQTDINNRYAYINQFIEENGVETLLTRFKTKSVMLSEFSNIVNKYHKIIIEKADKNDPCTFKIQDEDKDKFFEEIDNKEVDKVAEVIKQRVTDAVDKFIQDNAADKEKIKEIIDHAKEKIEKTKNEKVAESYRVQTNRLIGEVRTKRVQSLFEHMVLSISRNVIKDETLKESFMSNGKLDMDKVLETAIAMYTFLETINTAKIVDVNKDYIQSVYKQLNA